MVDVVQRWYFLRWHSNKILRPDKDQMKLKPEIIWWVKSCVYYLCQNHITPHHRPTNATILTDMLLDVNPRTVFNDRLWKLAWLTKLEKDSSKQTTSNTTQLKKRPTGSPTDQTEQSKLANERYSSLRATTHFTAKLTNQSNQRWNVWLRDNSSLDSADFCLGQSLVTTTALFQNYYYTGDRTARLTTTR